VPRPGDSSRNARRGSPDPAESSDRRSPAFAPGNAREAAYLALEIFREQTIRIADAWERAQTTAALSAVDRSLSRELAFGVVRRELTLDVLLRKLVSRPLEDIEPPLKTILQLGLYQLAFTEQIPQHAAVHETVELAKRVGRLRWSGFVNGILRSATRLITEEFTETPSDRALPVSHCDQRLRFRCLAKPVFHDPARDFAGYFRDAYGYPAWLAARWAQRFSPDQLLRLGHWQRNPPLLFLRVNLWKNSRNELLQQFLATGLDVATEALPEALRVISGGRVEQWPGYDAGLFSVQDLSAMQAARRLALTPGSLVLDLCAAPGGKSCHLAELMQNQGDVIAVDVAPQRLERIVHNASRLGLTAVQAVLCAEDGHDLPRGPFDFVLADVPCSNTGVIGRRLEVPKYLTLSDIQELSRLQLELLHRAADRVRPGGRVLYSTCSIEAEEDEQIVRKFLGQRPTFRLIEEELLLPGSPADGGYQALLERHE
jgi:16S rRNA (cytosine967-C5)-methyltransferase